MLPSSNKTVKHFKNTLGKGNMSQIHVIAITSTNIRRNYGMEIYRQAIEWQLMENNQIDEDFFHPTADVPSLYKHHIRSNFSDSGGRHHIRID